MAHKTNEQGKWTVANAIIVKRRRAGADQPDTTIYPTRYLLNAKPRNLFPKTYRITIFMVVCRLFPVISPPASNRSEEHQLPGNAIVVMMAFSAWRESRRVCCTTIGTSDVITLA